MPASNLAVIVAKAAIAKGMSVSDLARRADVSRPNLSAWINGRADIKVSTLERIMAELGLAVRASR